MLDDDFEGALGRLPTTYAALLRLRRTGSSTEEMAARLEIEPEAVGPLLAIAEAKLASILAQ